jgi:hypothetical protein
MEQVAPGTLLAVDVWRLDEFGQPIAAQPDPPLAR